MRSPVIRLYERNLKTKNQLLFPLSLSIFPFFFSLSLSLGLELINIIVKLFISLYQLISISLIGKMHAKKISMPKSTASCRLLATHKQYYPVYARSNNMFSISLVCITLYHTAVHCMIQQTAKERERPKRRQETQGRSTTAHTVARQQQE